MDSFLVDPCIFRPLQDGKSVVWEVTRFCPLSCRHCCTSSGSQYRTGLDADAALAVLGKLIANGVGEIYFSGGEPLLWKPIWPVLETARARGIECCIATSGYSVTQSVSARLAKLDLEIVNISLDSFSSEIHDELRGQPGAFDKAVNAVRMFLKLGVPVATRSVITPALAPNLEKMVEFLVDLGVRHAGFNTIAPLGRGEIFINRCFSPDERNAVFSELEELARTHETLHIDLRRQTSSTTGLRECPAGARLLHIDPEGRVSPCSWIAKAYPEFSEEIATHGILRPEALNRFRAWAWTVLDVGCSQCSLSETCGRGCPAAEWLNPEQGRGPDPLCAIRRDNGCA